MNSLITRMSNVSSEQAERIARSISIALVPPACAALVFTVLILQFQHGSMVHRSVVWFTAVLCSGGLQIIYVLLLRHEGRVSAYDVPVQRQRTQPYLISSAISLVGLGALLLLDSSILVWGLMWCFTINTLVLAVINSRWKISAHMMGLTGPAMFLIPSFGAAVLLLLPVAVVLGWARVRTGTHTISQVVAGGAAGIVLVAVQLPVLYTYGMRFAALFP